MPRRSSRTSSDASDGRRNPRRGSKKSYNDDEEEEHDAPMHDAEDAMDVDDDEASRTEPESDDDDENEGDDESDEGLRSMVIRRRSNSKGGGSSSSSSSDGKKGGGRRSSSRAGRFAGSMKEPPSDSVRDLFQGVTKERTGGGKTSPKKKGSSPVKSPARRHHAARKTIKEDTSDEESLASADEYASEEDDGDENEDNGLKIQRILASRTETKAKWKEIVKNMNTTEITDGSCWFQPDEEHEAGEQVEERFLVKWNGLSYLHVSWETQADLLEQIEGAKTYLSTFFRKSVNGILLSQDDRKDGDYFDPGYVQIDRILDSFYETKAPTTWEEELKTTNKTFGIVTDKSSPDFEEGSGRQFLVKWEGMNYSECTYEFERDFILADIDYKTPIKEFYERTKKPTKAAWKQTDKEADQAMRRSYKIFGDNIQFSEASVKEEQVKAYQKKLADHVFRNGGQLRDYQAEGVSWFLANYVNQRSCILADEMGLGKTLQTAAFVNLLVTEMHRPGPFLVVVPLSTMTHWQREFMNWTGLNTIVYHGSAEDRHNIRSNEFAYPQDRPDSVGSNTIYLKKCTPHHKGGPWMATVIVTTPEMLTADDNAELAAVDWEVLVVDEAHRLKNHNSKLATNLRKEQFNFKHKVLLTGTPIQNDIKEFWTLLNFIDPDNFPDVDDFLEKYGEIKSKERIDEMHDTIRPYILRRLKEDVEKSVPPKEETLIEVELTIQQKQYYRALYEKNVGFLHKNKKKALDGPSLNNLAMQLRKCCNHLYLLNGVEDEIRKQEENKNLGEADLLARGSGKLVLLDKLLPRLQENGHRVLIFSQFKIMLDVLEDYLFAKEMKFERIDGSITGHRRQAAIDRYQDKNSKNPPFIMLLSTRAGGVGINLTQADTCIIFDSDWNPQNDLQAQARCHRIGQTKNVKVYRLLSRKSYEMQMFHMSSLKMGLDQAVLKGFESGASGEGAMTKEEVERLLRHGAYDIFNEEKAGSAEAESNDFIQQDIDSILERRARTVVHDNTGSGSNAAGGTFSKASFVAPKTPSGKAGQQVDDVDIEDPDFWKKMVGEKAQEAESVLKPRRRNKANYSEKFYERQLHEVIALDPNGSGSDESDSDDSDESDSDTDDVQEKTRWGGTKPHHWKKLHAKQLLESLERYGYANLPWDQFANNLPEECSKFSQSEIQRMSWSMVLLALCEMSKEDASSALKRAEKQRERKREQEMEGDSLAQAPAKETPESVQERLASSFKKIFKLHCKWIHVALKDAVAFASENEPRSTDDLQNGNMGDEISEIFYKSLWGALQGRGWKEETIEGGKLYKYADHKFDSPSSVLNQVVQIHPELANMVIPILNTLEQSRLRKNRREEEDRERHLNLTVANISFETLQEFLVKYSPLQLIGDRKHSTKLAIGRRLLSSCGYMFSAKTLVEKATSKKEDLKEVLFVDGRSGLPHPLWKLDHDAVLIKAIAKHGWVDREKACRAMINDSEIKWGYPFEITTAENRSELSKEEMSDLRTTAQRAAAFLESFPEVIEVLKGCSRQKVIESFGLRHRVDEEEGSGTTWVVDDELLHIASNKEDDKPIVEEADDLPQKKDMAKRAKILIQKSMAALEGGGAASSKSSTNSQKAGSIQNHNFAVIDQSNRYCMLLAEMVKGIAKGSHTKNAKQVRLLGSIAYEEATALEKLFSSRKSEEDQQRAKEMRKIVDQIVLGRQSMKVCSTPGKNLFRVMIGLDAVQPKNKTEPVFPSKEFLERLASTTSQTKKEIVKKEEGALGEKAVLRSLKKAHDKSKDGVPALFAAADNFDFGIQLTMTEALLLIVFCTNGIPLSQSSFKGDFNKKITWEASCNLLEISAKEYYRTAQDKIQKARSILQKYEGQPNQSDAAKKVAAAEWEGAMAEEAVRQTSDLKPEQLAKKSIMLLEKVRRFAFINSHTNLKNAHKFENYLGSKIILSWISKEFQNLGDEYDVIDDSGKPMCYSTTDLLSMNPEYANTRVAAYLDKKSSRQVITQISLLSRLRLLFLKNDEEEMRRKVSDAVAKSRKLQDQWDKIPPWWSDDSHSYLLLKRLNEKGFSNVLADGSGFGPEEDSGQKSLKDLGLTRSLVQQRANQLVRELHAGEEAVETLRLLEERRSSRGSIKKQGYDRSLAECHTSSKGTTPKGGIQTGLRAFFSATKSTSKKSKVVVLSDDEENAITTTGKRKDSPASSPNDSPIEKKPKKLAPLFRVIPEKRKEGSSPTSATTPNKKLQTIVNKDGVIELISVPK